MQKISSQEYVRNFVREHNYNLYLLHFFAPRTNRRQILALMGLHTELRIIPTKVHDPMMRIIRLKWWEEELEKIKYNQSYAVSPILNELATIENRHEFSEYFIRLDKSLRGEDADIDESFYKILYDVIANERAKNRFIKKLMHHDQLKGKNAFRALRLWLGI